LVAADIPTIAESQITNLTTDLAAKAPLANPSFTGTVTAVAITTTGNMTAANYVNKLVYTIEGGGAAITTGSKGYNECLTAGTITGWTILADQSGSCVIDVKKASYSGFPTTTSIGGTSKPTLSSAQKNTDSTLSGWGTTSVSAGDVFEFVVSSASTVTRVQVFITIKIS